MRLDKDGEEAANNMNLKKKSHCLEIYNPNCLFNVINP